MPRRNAVHGWLLLGAVLAIDVSSAGCTLDRSGATESEATQASAASGAGGASDTTSASVVGSAAVTTSTSGSGSAGGADSGGGSTSDGGGGPGSGGAAASSGAASTATATATATSTAEASSSASTGAGPVCGNGAIEPPETCDVGDVTPGDRCSATCQIENPDTCPGTPIRLEAGTITIVDSTAGADDTLQDTQGAGECFGSPLGADLIYQITPAVAGTLKADLDAQFGTHLLVLRTSCPTSGSDVVDCEYDNDAGDIDHVEADVEAGAVHYVVVDSYFQASGGFSLRLELETGD